MKILAIETCLEYGSVALDIDGSVFSAKVSDSYSHLREIYPLIERLLSEAGLSARELDYVSVDNGPGSFTGIRIGVTAARTICQITGAKAVSLSSLLSIAASSASRLPVLSIINARRRQVYGAMYQKLKDGEYKTLLPEGQYMIDEIIELAKLKSGNGYIINGDGIDAYEEEIQALIKGGEGELASPGLRIPNAEGELALIKSKIKRGITLSYEELLPRYMRLAEAEQRLRDGALSDRIKF